MSATVPIAAIFRNAVTRCSFPFFTKKRMSQLECNADPGEIFVGITAAGLIWIYNRDMPADCLEPRQRDDDR